MERKVIPLLHSKVGFCKRYQAFWFGIWRAGALQGNKPEQAFFVKCDRTTITQGDIDNGRLIYLVGVAVVKPAEFIIFRIGQWTAEHQG